MFSTHGFGYDYPKSYVPFGDGLGLHATDYFGVHSNTLGGWYAPPFDHEAGPWPWQWNEVTRTQEVCDAFESSATRTLN